MKDIKRKLSGPSFDGPEKISVIITVYNVEPYLGACLRSVASQTYRNLEILIVDDGSTDKSAEICDAFAEREPRARVIRQENKGPSAARNRGTEEASGAYITYVDGDDILLPDCFALLFRNLKRSRAEISVAGHQTFQKEKELKKKTPVLPDYELLSGKKAAERIIKDHETNMITAWGKLYDRRLKPFLHYPEGKIHEDDFTTYKVFYEAERVAVSRAALYGLRTRSGSITDGFSLKRLEKLEALRESIGWLEERKEKELSGYAKLLYIKNLEIAWFRVNKYLKTEKALERDLIRAHQKAVQKYRDETKPLSGFADRCMIRIFSADPRLYRKFAGVYAFFFRERSGILRRKQ